MTKISITPIISYIIKCVRYLLSDEWKVRDGNTKSNPSPLINFKNSTFK